MSDEHPSNKLSAVAPHRSRFNLHARATPSAQPSQPNLSRQGSCIESQQGNHACKLSERSSYRQNEGIKEQLTGSVPGFTHQNTQTVGKKQHMATHQRSSENALKPIGRCEELLWKKRTQDASTCYSSNGWGFKTPEKKNLGNLSNPENGCVSVNKTGGLNGSLQDDARPSPNNMTIDQDPSGLISFNIKCGEWLRRVKTESASCSSNAQRGLFDYDGYDQGSRHEVARLIGLDNVQNQQWNPVFSGTKLKTTPVCSRDKEPLNLPSQIFGSRRTAQPLEEILFAKNSYADFSDLGGGHPPMRQPQTDKRSELMRQMEIRDFSSYLKKLQNQPARVTTSRDCSSSTVTDANFIAPTWRRTDSFSSDGWESEKMDPDQIEFTLYEIND